MQTDNEQIKTVEEDLINCEKELTEANCAAKRLRFEVKQAESNLRDVEKEDINNAKKIITLQRRTNRLMNEKERLNTAITNQELEERVDELYTKQIDFWEALEGQIKAKQEEANEYMAGLGKLLPPEIIIERMQSSIIGNTFNQEAVDIRGFKLKYEQAVREICKNKIEGVYVSSLELQKPKYLLDNFLFKPHIERIWNIQ
jgi:hypothetical protein